MLGILRPGCGRSAGRVRTGRISLSRIFRLRYWRLGGFLATFLVVIGGQAAALFAANGSTPSTTSDEARDAARRAIPLSRIAPEYRGKVAQVLKDPSIYRRLPTEVVDCQPEMFTLLAQNPEVLVEIWRKLGVSKVQLVRTGPNTFDLTDGMGTTGKLSIVEQLCEPGAQNRIVMYSEGRYEGKPFNKPVTANCVLLLTSGSMKETNGRHYVAARMDTFVRIDRPSLEILAKAVHPWVGKTTDQNFVDTMTFISNFSYTAENRPQTIARLANDLDRVDAARKNRLVRVAHECAEVGVGLRQASAVTKSARK